MLERLARLFAPDPPRPSRPRPSRPRAAARLDFRDHPRDHCAGCGMLLGAVALRRGRYPRCRAPIAPAGR